jgi:hypothetical protein
MSKSLFYGTGLWVFFLISDVREREKEREREGERWLIQFVICSMEDAKF